MDNADLLAAFENITLGAGQFNHENHIRLAWIYLQRFSLPEAMLRMREGLLRFTGHHGVTQKYNETLTCAYMVLIAERIAHDPGLDWPLFRQANPQLFTPWQQFLTAWYHLETLQSERARTLFLLPDRALTLDGAAACA